MNQGAQKDTAGLQIGAMCVQKKIAEGIETIRSKFM